MNGLSWLLYGAEVAGGLQVTLGIAGVAGVCVGIGAFAMSPLAGDTYSFQSAEERAEIKRRPKSIRSGAKKLLVWAAVALVVCNVLPSRNTLMLIAASEVGETVLASEAAQDIGGEAGALASDSLKLLRKYVSEQLSTPVQNPNKEGE